LETLAIIAYKQPITKSEMEAIRGVNCDYAVQKLLEKDLVVISGRKEDAVGQPLIYSTSKSFMDYFGINSADDLPKISEVMMEELVNATNVIEAKAEKLEYESDVAHGTPMEKEIVAGEEIIVEEDGIILAVTEEGQIIEETPDAGKEETEG